jgi:putative peptidoglycan lipid II flippase
VVNQVAYTVVTRLASGGSKDGGTGYTVYSQSFLVTQVPHSIITVSLATALLPLLSRKAADHDLLGLGHSLGETLRTCLALVVPIAALLALLPVQIAHLLYGYGEGADSYTDFGPTLRVFAFGLVLFTIHYLMLRGLYALERNRTAFYVQCVIGTVNILAAVAIVAAVPADKTAPGLAAAWSLAYLCGAATSYTVLRHRVGDLGGARLRSFVARFAVVILIAGGAAWLVKLELNSLDPDPGWLATLGQVVVVTAVLLCLVVIGCRLLRIQELTTVANQLARRLARR